MALHRPALPSQDFKTLELEQPRVHNLPCEGIRGRGLLLPVLLTRPEIVHRTTGMHCDHIEGGECAVPQWAGSDRRSRLPADWSAIRKRVLRRDSHRCTFRDPDTRIRCAEFATDVDHIIAGDDHRESNLRSLCGFHHQKKSSGEGGAAMAAKRREIDQRFRRRETHPGAT